MKSPIVFVTSVLDLAPRASGILCAAVTAKSDPTLTAHLNSELNNPDMLKDIVYSAAKGEHFNEPAKTNGHGENWGLHTHTHHTPYTTHTHAQMTKHDKTKTAKRHGAASLKADGTNS